MKDKYKQLMLLLKEIFDDHDFVCGTMSNCGGEEAWGKLYDFIVFANEHNEKITPDDILALSLSLGQNKDSGDKWLSFNKGRIAVF